MEWFTSVPAADWLYTVDGNVVRLLSRHLEMFCLSIAETLSSQNLPELRQTLLELCTNKHFLSCNVLGGTLSLYTTSTTNSFVQLAFVGRLNLT